MSAAGSTRSSRSAARRCTPCLTPSDPSQAVIQNVPFFVEGLNFGDLVHLGEPDHIGVRPIEAVVTASGHTRYLLLLEDLPVPDLFERMEDVFPPYAIRMESGADGLVALSVHPDLDPDDVAEAIFGWVADHVPFDEDLWDRTALCITEPIRTRIGPLSR